MSESLTPEQRIAQLENNFNTMVHTQSELIKNDQAAAIFAAVISKSTSDQWEKTVHLIEMLAVNSNAPEDFLKILRTFAARTSLAVDQSAAGMDSILKNLNYPPQPGGAPPAA